MSSFLWMKHEAGYTEWFGFKMYDVTGVWPSNLQGSFEEFGTRIRVSDNYHIIKCDYEWFWSLYQDFVDNNYLAVGLGQISLN